MYSANNSSAFVWIDAIDRWSENPWIYKPKYPNIVTDRETEWQIQWYTDRPSCKASLVLEIEDKEFIGNGWH